MAVHTGYRLEPAELHLKVGYERLTETFVERGLIAQEAVRELAAKAEQEAASSVTFRELSGVYRRAAGELQQLLTQPVEARRDNNLQRAVAFVHDHLGEPFRLEDVARAGGFSPHYFSRVFKKREKTTFEHYVQRLRVERAQGLLSRTTLDIAAIGQLSGFASTSYFHRVFRRITAQTPRQYRERDTRELNRQHIRARRAQPP
ncbi:MAG TPA: AraC family transcriptional regulator [Polyangiaceae bacterium]|nr:AraC family transcriptional regulator [Polyangiaceae bacterium]